MPIAGSKIYNRSQSAPGQEFTSVRQRTRAPPKPKMQRQTSLLQRTAVIRR